MPPFPQPVVRTCGAQVPHHCVKLVNQASLAEGVRQPGHHRRLAAHGFGGHVAPQAPALWYLLQQALLHVHWQEAPHSVCRAGCGWAARGLPGPTCVAVSPRRACRTFAPAGVQQPRARCPWLLGGACGCLRCSCGVPRAPRGQPMRWRGLRGAIHLQVQPRPRVAGDVASVGGLAFHIRRPVLGTP